MSFIAPVRLCGSAPVSRLFRDSPCNQLIILSNVNLLFPGDLTFPPPIPPRPAPPLESTSPARTRTRYRCPIGWDAQRGQRGRGDSRGGCILGAVLGVWVLVLLLMLLFAAQHARRLERLVRRTRRRRIDSEFLAQSDEKWVQSRK